jgi:hypothetical protein
MRLADVVRSAMPGRDLSEWQVVKRLHCVSVPVRLFRRLILSEGLARNRWSESTVANTVSPLYSPLRPPPRYFLRVDPVYTSLTTLGVKLRSLVAVVALHRSKELQGGSGGVKARRRSGSDGSGDFDKDRDRDGGDDVPAHLVRTAPLLAQLLRVHACGGSLEQTVHSFVTAAGRVLGATMVLFYEVDAVTRRMIQRVGPLSSANTRPVALTGTACNAAPLQWAPMLRCRMRVSACLCVSVLCLRLCLPRSSQHRHCVMCNVGVGDASSGRVCLLSSHLLPVSLVPVSRGQAWCSSPRLQARRWPCSPTRTRASTPPSTCRRCPQDRTSPH